MQDDEATFDNYSTAEDKGQQVNVESFYNSIEGGNKGESIVFEIAFGSKDTEVSSVSLSKTPSIVHPAFEAFNSNGFWVRKFETGYNQNEDGSVTPTDSWNKAGAANTTGDSTKIIIKPNVYSWRITYQIANAFYISYNYKRDLESHMMKNTEWGAVVYLAQSEYGRCDSNNQNCSEIRFNNSENFITGMSAKEATTCGYTGTKEKCNWYDSVSSLNKDGDQVESYYNKNSVIASTTGNYYGIYDMAGGTWEYVMGVMQSSMDNPAPATGPNATTNSGFNGPYSNANGQKEDGLEWPSSKYYDLYDYATSTLAYQRGLLGDATKELGPFYSIKFPTTSGIGPSRYVNSYNADTSNFVYSANPWFRRGGDYLSGSGAGIGAFYIPDGRASSFRIVLTP